MIIHALQTSTPFVYEVFVWCTFTAYTITYSEHFIYKWSTCLQSMYNHMVGRTASVISPFYSLLPDTYQNNSNCKFIFARIHNMLDIPLRIFYTIDLLFILHNCFLCFTYYKSSFVFYLSNWSILVLIIKKEKFVMDTT